METNLLVNIKAAKVIPMVIEERSGATSSEVKTNWKSPFQILRVIFDRAYDWLRTYCTNTVIVKPGDPGKLVNMWRFDSDYGVFVKTEKLDGHVIMYLQYNSKNEVSAPKA